MIVTEAPSVEHDNYCSLVGRTGLSAPHAGPDRKRRLIAKGPRHIVGIKTWGELIEKNRDRLQFFQEHLQHSADENTAIRYLQEKHSQFLEGVIVDDADENGGDQPEALAQEAARRTA